MKGVFTMMILKVAALFVGSIICIVAVFSCIMAEEKGEKLDAFLKVVVAALLMYFGNF